MEKAGTMSKHRDKQFSTLAWNINKEKDQGSRLRHQGAYISEQTLQWPELKKERDYGESEHLKPYSSVL